jgi:hypothetical protein
MDAEAKGFVQGLEKCFVELKDPRVQGRCYNLFIDILAIALLGVLCGGVVDVYMILFFLFVVLVSV